MREVWAAAIEGCGGYPTGTRLPALGFHAVPPRRGDGSDDGPVAHTTGLGLPLSRALANAMGGWLGLESSLPLPMHGPGAPLSLPRNGSPHTDGSSGFASAELHSAGSPASGSSDVHDMTHFWCVLEAPLAELDPDASEAVVAVTALFPDPPAVVTPGPSRGDGADRRYTPPVSSLPRGSSPVMMRTVNLSPGGVVATTAPVDRVVELQDGGGGGVGVGQFLVRSPTAPRLDALGGGGTVLSSAVGDGSVVPGGSSSSSSSSSSSNLGGGGGSGRPSVLTGMDGGSGLSVVVDSLAGKDHDPGPNQRQRSGPDGGGSSAVDVVPPRTPVSAQNSFRTSGFHSPGTWPGGNG